MTALSTISRIDYYLSLFIPGNPKNEEFLPILLKDFGNNVLFSLKLLLFLVVYAPSKLFSFENIKEDLFYYDIYDALDEAIPKKLFIDESLFYSTSIGIVEVRLSS